MGRWVKSWGRAGWAGAGGSRWGGGLGCEWAHVGWMEQWVRGALGGLCHTHVCDCVRVCV